jgi:D-3-phosphoglycerate dehydrogenase
MSMTATIAISTSSFGKESSRPLDLLRAAGFEVRANPHGRTLSTEEARAHLDGVIGLVAGTEKLTGDLLRTLPGLRVISRVGVGVDSIDLATARELGITVANTPDAHVQSVAELALAGILAALRKLPAGDASIRAGGFDKPMGRLLHGKTVGLVGFGKVARALSRLLAPFAVELLVTDVVRDDDAATALGARQVELHELLLNADVVSLHLPYSRSAHHLIGAAQLGRMKPEALLVNTSRGGLIDEEALVAHLGAHPKASAYLDCFEQEPYKGPLARCANAILTAHVGSYAREARVQMETQAVENLLRVLRPA